MPWLAIRRVLCSRRRRIFPWAACCTSWPLSWTALRRVRCLAALSARAHAQGAFEGYIFCFLWRTLGAALSFTWAPPCTAGLSHHRRTDVLRQLAMLPRVAPPCFGQLVARLRSGEGLGPTTDVPVVVDTPRLAQLTCILVSVLQSTQTIDASELRAAAAGLLALNEQARSQLAAAQLRTHGAPSSH